MNICLNLKYKHHATKTLKYSENTAFQIIVEEEVQCVSGLIALFYQMKWKGKS